MGRILAQEGTSRLARAKLARTRPLPFPKAGWKGPAASAARLRIHWPRGSFCHPVHFPGERSSARLRCGNLGERKTRCGPGSSVSARGLRSLLGRASASGTFKKRRCLERAEGLFAGAEKVARSCTDKMKEGDHISLPNNSKRPKAAKNFPL